MAQTTVPEIGPPQARRGEPQPEDAVRGILAAFGAHEIVGMNAGHGDKDQDDLTLSLIRHPAFPTTVNDIVVECGNSLYQSTLDRYVAGEDVPLSEVRQVWRNTTQNMCIVSSFYDELFPLVRRINQKLPPGRRLRVLAGDPPIDWHKANGLLDAAYVFEMLEHRDVNVASIIETQVLARHRKALMLYGVGHLFHGFADNAVGRYEKRYPSVTFVIYTHASLGCEVPSAKGNAAIEARLALWPVPSLALIKDTWLTDVPSPIPPLPNISKVADAYLYFGPRDLALSEPIPAIVFLDKEFMAELDRRKAIGVGSDPNIVDPMNVRGREANRFVCH